MTCRVCSNPTCLIHCVYCDVDVNVEEHRTDCPSTTGLFPVRPIDLGEECIHCGKRTPGMACPVCDTLFKVGDFYVQRQVGEAPGDVHIPIMMPVCVGCGATGAELPEERG